MSNTKTDSFEYSRRFYDRLRELQHTPIIPESGIPKLYSKTLKQKRKSAARAALTLAALIVKKQGDSSADTEAIGAPPGGLTADDFGMRKIVPGAMVTTSLDKMTPEQGEPAKMILESLRRACADNPKRWIPLRPDTTAEEWPRPILSLWRCGKIEVLATWVKWSDPTNRPEIYLVRPL